MAKIRYASVLFKGSSRKYTFKTIENLVPKDKVVVLTKNGLGTAEVYGTNLPIPENKIKYNWIVGVINLDKYYESFLANLDNLGIKESDK